MKTEQKSSQRGATLIEILISFAIIGIVLVTAIGAGSSCTGSGDAQKNADKFASKTGMQVIDVMSRDSDGDGYVSVTFKDQTGQILGGQCATGAAGTGCGNKGCKLDSAKVHRR